MFKNVDQLLEKRQSFLLRNPSLFMILALVFMVPLAFGYGNTYKAIWAAVVVCNSCALAFSLKQSRLTLELADRLTLLHERLEKVERANSA
jgi:lysylphosphatidylglycerol synthetase-like protein (DUF2156 family)